MFYEFAEYMHVSLGKNVAPTKPERQSAVDEPYAQSS